MGELRIPQITFTADYFRKTVRNESSYPLVWRVAKEVIQNSRDAGATLLTIIADSDNRTLKFVDNGGGMSEDVLLDTFLALGGSKKDKDIEGGAIGGFGDAKKVIFMCWDRWEIHTKTNFLTSEMLGVEPVNHVGYLDGTSIKIWLEDEYNFVEMMNYINLCQMSTLKIEVKHIEDGISKDIYIDTLHRRKLTRELDWGKLYVNKSRKSEMLVVRLNGLALFHKKMYGVPATAILELENPYDPKSDRYMLNVTRESLKWMYQSELEDIIREIVSQPKRSLDAPPKDEIEIFRGQLGSARTITPYDNRPKAMVSLKDYILSECDNELRRIDIDYNSMELLEQSNKMITSDCLSEDDVKFKLERLDIEQLLELAISLDKTDVKIPYGLEVIQTEIKEASNRLNEVYPYDFVIKGETNLKYDSLKYQKLLLAWHKTVEYVCYYNNYNEKYIDLGNYTVGFIFDNDVKAQYVSKNGNKFILLNPSDLNFTDFSWRAIVVELLNRACHEITHNLYEYHDGEFVAFESSIRTICLWYLEEFFEVIGGILRSSQDNLVENSMLNEVYDFD